MRLRHWLLTGTSLGLLALAPLPAVAQSAELTAAYQAYVDAQASGDAAATETALGALTEQCIVAGYATIDECIAALAAAPDAAAAAAAAAAAEAEAAAAAQAEADAAAAAQAEADAAAAAQAEADAAAAAQAEADAAAAAQAEADAAAAAQAEADAAAAAQAEADAKAAADAQAATDAQAAADAQAAEQKAAADAQFVADLNAALAEYQTALDQAAGGGDYAAAQAQAEAAAARILELCTANGYADIPSCIGQELPALPAPPAVEEPAPETPAEPAGEAPTEQPAVEQPAEQPAVEEPAAEPAAETPAEQPAAETPADPADVPPPIDPVVQAQADVTTAIELYNVGIGQLQAGDAAGQSTVDVAVQQITATCTALGYTDINQCLAELGFPPLAEVPVVEPAAEPAPEELSPAADEAVTPDAVEALPVAIAPEEAAPLLDSAKDVQTEVAAGEPVTETPPTEPTEPFVAPTSDADAQAKIAPVEVQSVEAVQGERIADTAIALAPAPELQAAELPQNVTIINNVTNVTNNTTIINNNAPSAPVIFQVGINIVINNPGQERDRMYRPDEDRIFYEELRNGRTRETIVRPNGVRIVTIRNRWGDVLKRSRFSPDGREFILAYYDEEDDDRDDRESFFIDPGEDLPPLRLNIPARDYILDVEDADEEEVELFFRQPPVEQVRRIYSVEEVKRSARVRDSVRRIEVGGLTFDSGKATISSSQVGALSKVARAMLAVLDENPAETFLIEGHTDAVGSDTANLVLSDQRAAVVAQILTDFYKVPPENLVTQGYGERYLKVKTQGDEPINRRVTIKRITSLITVAEN